MFEKKIGEYFFVAPSRRQFKKYDVYKNGDYLLSFGDNRYKHYEDKIGAYDYLDHHNDKKRYAFKSRHNKRLNDFESATWFADKFLW
jgi:hypothetical protein